MGRPPALSTKQIGKLVDTVENMVNVADANYELMLTMVLRRSRLNTSETTVARALHMKEYRYKKPLSPGDFF